MGNVERHQLEGDAKNSPLTEVSHNNYFSLGAAYQY
jgi:outer membrane scaffolding protein for murein synthesis (MipA/OmpV family)